MPNSPDTNPMYPSTNSMSALRAIRLPQGYERDKTACQGDRKRPTFDKATADRGSRTGNSGPGQTLDTQFDREPSSSIVGGLRSEAGQRSQA